MASKSVRSPMNIERRRDQILFPRLLIVDHVSYPTAVILQVAVKQPGRYQEML